MDFMRWLATLLLLSSIASAGISDSVKIALSQGNLAGAESELQAYRAQQGATPDYIEGLSWLARGYLLNDQLDRAQSVARQAETLTRAQIRTRPLDGDPHLPLALGAAIEVESQVLAAQGHHAQAVALLRRSLATYGTTSIRSRLQKNLNLLGLTGRPAPTLHVADYLGVRPPALASVKGSPVLMFFWAHWCSDCKAEGPVIAQLASEFGSRLNVIAPTQLYGYAARGETATPKDELAYIAKVWQTFYPALQAVAVPVSKQNFDNYGASTTPTLVLVDRAGRVALYHPGVMPYDELRAAVQKALQ
jgi:thiol-disulfide isomerase/thioredoxin